MSRQARSRPEMTDDSRLARVRERFLTAEPIEQGQVRDTILASWRRCRQWHVAADRIDLSYVRDPDLDTPLTRNALPVLQSLRESVQGEAVSVILTDGGFPAVWFWQREMRLDVVPVAAAVLLLDYVAGLDQGGDDAESAALGDVQARRHVAQAHPGVMSHAQQHPGVVGQEGPARHPDKLPDSGKYLLVL